MARLTRSTVACEERPGTNLKGSQGHAFTCRYRLTDTPMQIAAPIAAPPTPLPAKAALISAPPVAKTTAQPAAQPAALATPAPEKSATTAPSLQAAVAKASTPVLPITPITPITPPPPEAAADQLNAKVRAAFDAPEARDRQKQADYEAAQKKAADDFARQLADHGARVKAQKAEYEASMAAWRARVAACKAGDASQCADSSIPPPSAK